MDDGFLGGDAERLAEIERITSFIEDAIRKIDQSDKDVSLETWRLSVDCRVRMLDENSSLQRFLSELSGSPAVDELKERVNRVMQEYKMQRQKLVPLLEEDEAVQKESKRGKSTTEDRNNGFMREVATRRDECLQAAAEHQHRQLKVAEEKLNELNAKEDELQRVVMEVENLMHDATYQFDEGAAHVQSHNSSTKKSTRCVCMVLSVVGLVAVIMATIIVLYATGTV